jgi:DNA-binding MarR family transcriptional regulator
MDDFALERFLPFRLNRLAAEVSLRLSGIYAARFGIDIPQWRVLATLSSGPATTAQDIAASTRTHKSTVSRAVKALEKRGLVERAGAENDGRMFRLKLTAEGRKLFKSIAPLVLGFERDLEREMGSANARALDRGVGALEAALRLGKEAR